MKTLSLEPENIYKVFPGQGNGWGFGKFITHEMLKGLPTAMLLLSKDNLTIVCDLTLRAEKKTNIPGLKLLQNAKTKKNFTSLTL